jgi:hypothetical protein
MRSNRFCKQPFFWVLFAPFLIGSGTALGQTPTGDWEGEIPTLKWRKLIEEEQGDDESVETSISYQGLGVTWNAGTLNIDTSPTGVASDSPILWNDPLNWDSLLLQYAYVQNTKKTLLDGSEIQLGSSGDIDLATYEGLNGVINSGPTEKNVSVTVRKAQLPAIPAGVEFNIGARLRFSVNLDNNQNVLLNQYSTLEGLRVPSGAFLEIDEQKRLSTESDFDNTGVVQVSNNARLHFAQQSPVNDGIVRVLGGEISADSAVRNNGIIRGGAPATSLLIPPSVDNHNGALVVEGGGRVRFRDTTIKGGILRGQGDFIGKDGTLDGTEEGLAIRDATVYASGRHALTLEGAITNTGRIEVSNRSVAQKATLNILGDVSVTGDGEIVIDSQEGTENRISTFNGHLTTGAEQTLRIPESGNGLLIGDLTNNGQVEVQGELDIDKLGKFVNKSAITVHDGGKLRFLNEKTYDNRKGMLVVEEGGRVKLPQGTIKGGILRGQGDFIGKDGTLDGTEEGLAIRDATVYASGRHALTLEGAITNTGRIEVSNRSVAQKATLNILGDVSVTGDGEIVIDSQEGTENRISTFNGHLTTGAEQTLRIPESGNGLLIGDLTNNGQVEVQGELDIDKLGKFVNKSAITVHDGGKLRFLNEKTYDNRKGMLVVEEGGRVKLTEAALMGGKIKGNGTITSWDGFTNDGLVSPGRSIGSLDISGDFEQHESGELLIEISGDALSEHDLLNISGQASLDGKLSIQVLDGFDPKVGDTFNIIDFGSHNGVFATIEVAGGDYTFEPRYRDRGLSLKTVEVPEPGTFAILGCGVIVAFLRPARPKSYKSSFRSFHAS